MKIGIIGGGASGMAAAITASSLGAAVTILEKKERVGSKILATGNGKCNLSNQQIGPDCYHSEDPSLIASILERFSVREVLDFFQALGLMVRVRNGGFYPACEQASAVLDVLRFALARGGIAVETGCLAVHAACQQGTFLVHTEGMAGKRVFSFDRLILACGSSAGLGTKETDNGLKLAGEFSLKRIPFSPALVQLCCRETCCRAMAGVRCQAEVTLRAAGTDYREQGEVQMTDYGISGIPVFQISRHASAALKQQRELAVFLDFLPGMETGSWQELLKDRVRTLGQESAERFFTGTVHKKIIAVILKECGISPGEIIRHIPQEKLTAAGEKIKHFPLTVTGTNPFSKAQVCAGGVRLSEVTDNLEAKGCKGLYITGELLDADGRCGGYNLHWAWATGVLAGRAAAEERPTRQAGRERFHRP